jgi:beta-galactosidase-like protein/alpha-galactosidase-like protein
VPINLQITDDPTRHYRAFIFLNGWMMGIYINDLGPQHLFSLPTGILNPNGQNELAIAVWSEDDQTGGLGSVSLVSAGSYWGGVPVRQVESPQWNAGEWGPPSAPENLVVDIATNAQIVSSGTTTNLTAYITNASDNPARDVAVTLNAPSGWVVAQNSTANNAAAENPTITIPALGAGQSTAITWSVTAPPNVAPGSYPLAITAAYQSTTGTTINAAGTTTLQVAYQSLASVFDNVGVTSNSDPNPSPGFLGFDGIGTTYSAEGLAAAGISAGEKISTFIWPDVGPGVTG